MIDIHDQQKDIIRRFCQYAEHNLSAEEEKLQRFREQSKDLLYKLGSQLNELHRLRKWAQSTEEAVSYLRCMTCLGRNRLTLHRWTT